MISLECDGLPSLCHSERWNRCFKESRNQMTRLVTKRRQAVALQSRPMISTPHQLIRRSFRIENFLRAFNSGNRQCVRIDQSELCENRGLVPINMFVGQLAVTKV